MSQSALPGHDCPPPASYEETDVRKMTSAFMENTTAHGLARIAASRTKIRKTIWVLILGGALTFLGWQLNSLITLFFSYPIAINTRIENMHDLIFPAVTVCNMNAMKRGRLVNSSIYGLLVKLDEENQAENGATNLHAVGGELPPISGVGAGSDGDISAPKNTTGDYGPENNGDYSYIRNTADDYASASSYQYYYTESFDYNYDYCHGHDDNDREACLGELQDSLAFTDMTNAFDWTGYLGRAVTTDLSDLVDVYKPNITDLQEYGTDAAEFILQCSFDKKDCSYQNFIQSANGRYGMCYTFNRGDNQAALVTRKYGSRYGLRLTLYIDREEYVGMFSPRVGVVVALHHPDAPVFPEDSGIITAPGMETVIGVRQEEVHRQRAPYPSNCSNGEDIPVAYTVTACSMSCLQTALLRECNCNDRLDASGTEPRCSVVDEEQMLCRHVVYEKYKNDDLVCDCRPACREVKYQATVSSAVWPSAPYLNIIRNEIVKRMKDQGVDPEALRSMEDDEKLKTDVVRIQVYLEDQTVRIINEIPAYPVERLLADLGGLLGLFMGISICSAVEVLEFCIDMVIVCVKRRQQRKKTDCVEEASPKS